jgi:hypothetical protein
MAIEKILGPVLRVNMEGQFSLSFLSVTPGVLRPFAVRDSSLLGTCHSSHTSSWPAHELLMCAGPQTFAHSHAGLLPAIPSPGSVATCRF